MEIQRLRNLTTGRLHTEMAHIYEDIEYLTGEEGVMTHTIPAASRALKPWLKKMVSEPRFWNGEYDTEHTGEYPMRPMNSTEQNEFWQRFKNG